MLDPICSGVPRRAFLRQSAAALAWLAAGGPGWSRGAKPGVFENDADFAALRGRVDALRPSRVHRPASFYRDWLGTTLVAGRYYLTARPALLEGAEQMRAFGTSVGKFWFEPQRAVRDYPWNSHWPEMHSLVELAQSEYWDAVFRQPFTTMLLDTSSPAERGWNAEHGETFYAAIASEWEELGTHLYRRHGNRPLTIILQNWEGDWQLRGAGESWAHPPADWSARCDRFARRLAARQAGLNRARAAAPTHCRLRVLHAAEVNRVVDYWSGVPTMMQHVLPQVAVDLVSYSCYDAMQDGPTLLRAIETLRGFARTDGPLGPGAVCLGEIGIPENVAPHHIADRWDELLGAAVAGGVHWVAQWALYCNELASGERGYRQPVRDPHQLRGFWLLRPDGTLSETGKVFRRLWGT